MPTESAVFTSIIGKKRGGAPKTKPTKRRAGAAWRLKRTSGARERKATARPNPRSAPRAAAPAWAGATIPWPIAWLRPLVWWPFPLYTPPTLDDLQVQVDEIIARAGYTSGVRVELNDDPEFSAQALGLRKDRRAEGTITVGRRLLTLLTPPELRYVLAHEVWHILDNHLAGRLGLRIVRLLVEGVARKRRSVKAMLDAYDADVERRYAAGDLPLWPSVMLAQEVAADVAAVREVGGDVSIARGALRKLAKGNLGAPSHHWRLGPIASLETRLAQVERKLSARPV